jgi:hypothetical protein
MNDVARKLKPLDLLPACGEIIIKIPGGIIAMP